MPNYLSNMRPEFEPFELNCGTIKGFQYKGDLKTEIEKRIGIGVGLAGRRPLEIDLRGVPYLRAAVCLGADGLTGRPGQGNCTDDPSHE